MPLDPNSVQWDAGPDPASVKWDDVPAEKPPSRLDEFLRRLTEPFDSAMKASLDIGASALSHAGAAALNSGGNLLKSAASGMGIGPETPTPTTFGNAFIHHVETPEGQQLARGFGNAVTNLTSGPYATVAKAAFNKADAALAQHAPWLEGADRRMLSTLGDVANVAPFAGLAGKAVGALDAASTAKAATAVATPPSTIVENLRAIGIKLRPSDAAAAGAPGSTPGIGGRILEGATGSPEMGRELSIQNIVPLQARAAKYIGADLSGTEGRFTPQVFDTLAASHNAVYDKLAAVRAIPQSSGYGDVLSSISTKGSSPETTAAVEKMIDNYRTLGSSQDIVSDVRTLRKRATQLIQSENPEFKQRGYAAKKIANAMDDELARRADAAGQTGLANEFKSSRVALAQIHTIEDATRAGIIDPKEVLAEQDNGIPLEGDAAIIAYAAKYAPHVTKNPLSFSSANPTHMPTSITGAVQGLLRNVGARGIMQGPYQNALGMAGLESRLSSFFPSHPIADIPRGPITNTGRLLPAPGEEWNPPFNMGNEGLNPGDISGGLYGHPGEPQPFNPNRLLALPAPGNTVGGAAPLTHLGNERLNLSDERMVAGHPGQAGYTRPFLRLPAPGQTSARSQLAEALTLGERKAGKQHPAVSMRPVPSTITEEMKRRTLQHIIDVLSNKGISQ